MKRLNIGCGNDIREGYVNLDKVPLEGVDVVWNVEKGLPFEDELFDEVLCKDILEHVDDYVLLLREIHRVLKVGGRAVIEVPHFTSENNFIDPTHKHMFSAFTFDFFVKGHPRSYYFDFHFSRIERRFIDFERRLLNPINYLVQPIVNISDFTRLMYEKTLLRIFPARNIIVVLVK